MARLIDADTLLETSDVFILHTKEYGSIDVISVDAVGDAHTVDAVEVVRCKDCANFRQNAHGVFWCDEYGGAITPNDYCSRAETDKQTRASIPWEAD